MADPDEDTLNYLRGVSGVWGSSWLNKQEECFWLITRPVSMFSGKPYTLFESVCRDRAGGPRASSTVQPEATGAPHCPVCERHWMKLLHPPTQSPSADDIAAPTSPSTKEHPQ